MSDSTGASPWGAPLPPAGGPPPAGAPPAGAPLQPQPVGAAQSVRQASPLRTPQPAAQAQSRSQTQASPRGQGPQPPRSDSAEPRWRKLIRVSGASIGLIIISLGLGLALAATLGGAAWLIATAIHHAASGG